MLPEKSYLRRLLSPQELGFLEHACAAIARLLPHVEVLHWTDHPFSARSQEISGSGADITLSIHITPCASGSHKRTLQAVVRRRKEFGFSGGVAKGALDKREREMCGLIATEITSTLQAGTEYPSASYPAMMRSFDEAIVAKHLASHHQIDVDVLGLLSSLHQLAEQTYENKSLSFGCVIDPADSLAHGAMFPGEYLTGKKFKALSDGYRTAYVVSRHGRLSRFVDLERYKPDSSLTEKHIYPEWAELIARASRDGRCGIALSRQGDILVFDDGTLRFTYRYGKWQYWNHRHLIHLLRDRARAQKIPKAILGNVVGAIYRAAIDVSFRRSGALFVVLHNRKMLAEMVRKGDAIGDVSRADSELQFDEIVGARKIQRTDRRVVVELASLDGAVVINNAGDIRAYGAVLQPRRRGKLLGSEGSRTKAAIGASNYGLALKVSSDGDITVYHKGRRYLSV